MSVKKWGLGQAVECDIVNNRKTIMTQTDDTGCNYGCTSIYVDKPFLCHQESVEDIEAHNNILTQTESEHVIKDTNNTTTTLQLCQDGTSIVEKSKLAAVVSESDIVDKDSFYYYNGGSNVEISVVLDESEELQLTKISRSTTENTNKAKTPLKYHFRSQGRVISHNLTLPNTRSTDNEGEVRKTDKIDEYDQVLTHSGEKPFKCKHCSKTFTQKSDCREHEKAHWGEKTFKCTHCNKAFTHNYQRTRHERIHSGEKPFKCKHCTKAFTQSGHCTRHERKKHLAENPFSIVERHLVPAEGIIGSCTQEKSHSSAITQNSSCRTHERIHSGEKPFKCKHCSKVFTHLGSCRMHERVHSGEKPFKCKHCSKAFTHLGSCRMHERVHLREKPFKCKHCNKAFTHLGSCRMHERVHSGEKPFKCIHCSKAFTHLGSCTRHERIHSVEKPFRIIAARHLVTTEGMEGPYTQDKSHSSASTSNTFTQNSSCRTYDKIDSGEKPFKCKHCSKTFKQKSCCRIHERIIHSGEKQ